MLQGKRKFYSAVSIVSIQTDQSRPFSCILKIVQQGSFNRINSDRSIPTLDNRNYDVPWVRQVSIVSIQTDQSRLGKRFSKRKVKEQVSIVSIQTDQSRPGLSLHNGERFAKRFQSYQFRQINPDGKIMGLWNNIKTLFQSYQFRQINPDCC